MVQDARMQETDEIEERDLFPSGVPTTERDKQFLMDQYKLAVEIWDRVRARRQLANSFYVTINSAVIVALWGKESPAFGSGYVALAGMIITVLWFLTILNFRSLADSKFTVICTLEKYLPSAPFRAEPRAPRSFPFTWTERCIPVVFFFMYAGMLPFANWSLPSLLHKGPKEAWLLSDIPPAGRAGPGFDVAVWHGIAAPAGIDPQLALRINGIFNQVLQTPAVRTAITETQAADIVGGTPAQFDAFIKSELQRWPEVVRAAGITPQ
jgi:hypothetical protein